MAKGSLHTHDASMISVLSRACLILFLCWPGTATASAPPRRQLGIPTSPWVEACACRNHSCSGSLTTQCCTVQRLTRPMICRFVPSAAVCMFNPRAQRAPRYVLETVAHVLVCAGGLCSSGAGLGGWVSRLCTTTGFIKPSSKTTTKIQCYRRSGSCPTTSFARY